MRIKLFISLALAAILVTAAITGYCYHRAQGLQIHDGGKAEQTWQESMDYCNALHGTWRLPAVDELYGIHLQGRLPVKGTDYWSSSSAFGYAFGVNTGSGILSFDRHMDIDHTICVRDIDSM